MLIIKKNNTKEGKGGGEGSKGNDERWTGYETKETKSGRDRGNTSSGGESVMKFIRLVENKNALNHLTLAENVLYWHIARATRSNICKK